MIYSCQICNYQTPVKCNYQKHLLSKKHQTRKNMCQQKNEQNEQKNEQNEHSEPEKEHLKSAFITNQNL